jgi:hypothetical protein
MQTHENSEKSEPALRPAGKEVRKPALTTTFMRKNQVMLSPESSSYFRFQPTIPEIAEDTERGRLRFRSGGDSQLNLKDIGANWAEPRTNLRTTNEDLETITAPSDQVAVQGDRDSPLSSRVTRRNLRRGAPGRQPGRRRHSAALFKALMHLSPSPTSLVTGLAHRSTVICPMALYVIIRLYIS